MLVETLVSGLAVEALDVAVLYQMSESDEEQRRATTMRPLIECTALEFRSVVTHGAPQSACYRDSVEDTRYALVIVMLAITMQTPYDSRYVPAWLLRGERLDSLSQ